MKPEMLNKSKNKITIKIKINKIKT